jgi:cytochrome c-type biogenesis protein CcmH/NrfG
MLEKLAGADTAEAFTLYALALEYRREGRAGDAIATFERLRAKDAEYLPMYLMAGELFGEEGREDEARAWLEAGIALATRKGDSKTRSELEAALERML